MAMVAKMSLRIWIRVLSLIIAVIPTCQMQVKSLGVKFLWIISKLKKNKPISLFLVHVPIKCDVKVHVRYFQVMVLQWWQMECPKKCTVHAAVLFCLFSLLRFWCSRFHHLCGILNSLILKWCYMEKFDERCNWSCTI